MGCNTSITFTLELNTSKGPGKNTRIFIRCTQNRQHKRISTGVAVAELSWDKIQRKIKKSDPLFSEKNKLILEKLRKLTNAYSRLVETNTAVYLEDLINAFNSDTMTDFFEFAHRTKMAEIQSRKKLGTYKRYESVLEKFKTFNTTPHKHSYHY